MNGRSSHRYKLILNECESPDQCSSRLAKRIATAEGRELDVERNLLSRLLELE